MDSTHSQDSSKPISVIVDRTILPGKREEFEEYVKGIIEASSKFAGYLGTDVINPESDNRYIVVFRFDSQKHLDDWTESEEREIWIKKIDQVIESSAKHVSVTGLESWFVISKSNSFTPPPKYKMALIVYLAISITLTCFDYVFKNTFSSIATPLKYWVTGPIIVIAMTYLVMPLMTKMFHRFLFN